MVALPPLALAVAWGLVAPGCLRGMLSLFGVGNQRGTEEGYLQSFGNSVLWLLGESRFEQKILVECGKSTFDLSKASSARVGASTPGDSQHGWRGMAWTPSGRRRVYLTRSFKLGFQVIADDSPGASFSDCWGATSSTPSRIAAATTATGTVPDFAVHCAG